MYVPYSVLVVPHPINGNSTPALNKELVESIVNLSYKKGLY